MYLYCNHFPASSLPEKRSVYQDHLSAAHDRHVLIQFL